MSETTSLSHPLQQMQALSDDSHNVHVIIETPQGKRNKYKYDEAHVLFTLSQVLPIGLIFPFDSIKDRPSNVLSRSNAERAQQLVHEGIARLQQSSASHP